MDEIENDDLGYDHTGQWTYSSTVDTAIDDGENLIAFAARTGKKIPENVFDTLITARGKWERGQWTKSDAFSFWEAFREINKLVEPATAGSVRAICFDKPRKGFRGFVQNQYGRSEATRAITRYTVWTLLVLALVLIVQIYWVVGNSLSSTLTELLNNESELTAAIKEANLAQAELEVLFKLQEEELRQNDESGAYEFYNSSDWERETLPLKMEIQQLEEDLEAQKIQLERNFGILQVWAFAWQESIENSGLQNDSILDNIADLKEQRDAEEARRRGLQQGDFQEQVEANQERLLLLDDELSALEAELTALATEGEANSEASTAAGTEGTDVMAGTVQQALRDKISDTLAKRKQAEDWLEDNQLDKLLSEIDYRISVLDDDIATAESQHARWQAKETVRRLRLSAEFLLVILQSYLLPVLYGLLGASVYVLRRIMREIGNATYNPDRSYLLRLALGTLSGLIIGWFIFLLPGSSILSALSPMALAFLVGYNIEIIFSAMDRAIEALTRKEGDEQQDGEEENREKNGDKPKEANLAGETGAVENQ